MSRARSRACSPGSPTASPPIAGSPTIREGLAYRIQGVRARLNLPALRVEGHMLLADACSELLDAAGPVVDRILTSSISR